jgi:hypothetical protein
MVAMDDFLTFKKLMVRRNMELELEAVRALQSANVKLKPASTREEEEVSYMLATSQKQNELDSLQHRLTLPASFRSSS